MQCFSKCHNTFTVYNTLINIIIQRVTQSGFVGFFYHKLVVVHFYWSCCRYLSSIASWEYPLLDDSIICDQCCQIERIVFECLRQSGRFTFTFNIGFHYIRTSILHRVCYFLVATMNPHLLSPDLRKQNHIYVHKASLNTDAIREDLDDCHTIK